MHVSLLLVTGLAAIATALPQRFEDGRAQFRGGSGSSQNAQGIHDGTQGGDLANAPFLGDNTRPSAAVPSDTTAGVGQIPGNTGNNGNKGNTGGANVQPDLSNQNSGNAVQHGNSTDTNGQGHKRPQGSQNGQNQNGQDQGGAKQPTGAFDPALVPQFGVQAGVSPDGQGTYNTPSPVSMCLNSLFQQATVSV